MLPLSRPAERAVFIAALLVMTATRFHHTSDWLHLPDASMALFFLGGLALRRHRYFIGLLLMSVLIDWAAVTLAGVSDFCITAAYAALPFAYGVLWYAGSALHARVGRSAVALGGVWCVGVLAAAVSFLISMQRSTGGAGVMPIRIGASIWRVPGSGGRCSCAPLHCIWRWRCQQGGACCAGVPRDAVRPVHLRWSRRERGALALARQ